MVNIAHFRVLVILRSDGISPARIGGVGAAGTHGSKSDCCSTYLTMYGRDVGIRGLCLIFNPAFADPVFHLLQRNMKVLGNIMFVDGICANKLFDFAE